MRMHRHLFAFSLLVCASSAAFAQSRTTTQAPGTPLQTASPVPTPIVTNKLSLLKPQQAPAPDLVISQFDIIPSNVQKYAGSGGQMRVAAEIKFIFTIKNQGNQAIPLGWIAFRAYLNDKLMVAAGPNDQSILYTPGFSGNQFWQLLQPGASVVVSLPTPGGVTVPVGSPFIGRVEVRSRGDSPMKLDDGTVVQPLESDTSNNVAQVNLIVP